MILEKREGRGGGMDPVKNGWGAIAETFICHGPRKCECVGVNEGLLGAPGFVCELRALEKNWDNNAFQCTLSFSFDGSLEPTTPLHELAVFERKT